MANEQHKKHARERREEMKTCEHLQHNLGEVKLVRRELEEDGGASASRTVLTSSPVWVWKILKDLMGYSFGSLSFSMVDYMYRCLFFSDFVIVIKVFLSMRRGSVIYRVYYFSS